MENSKRIACFTGHRPEKLVRDTDEIIRELESEIDRAVAEGINVFISGMARGVDLWAAEIVLKRKRINQKIRLVCAIPYRDFDRSWSTKWRDMYQEILSEADEVHTVRQKFSYSAFMERNRWMVDRCNTVIAVYNGGSGGTKNTLEYASQTNKILRIIRG